MEYYENTERIYKFIDQNSKLPRSIGNKVILRILENEFGILFIMMEITEEAKTKDLRAAIPLFLNWKKRLIKYQGKTGLYSDNFLLKKISDDHQTNTKRRNLFREYLFSNRGYATYKNITNALNQQIEEWLFESESMSYKGSNQSSPYNKILNTYLLLADENIPNPLLRAKALLRIFRYSEDAIEIEIDTCLETIRNGDFPSELGLPLTERKLKDAIRRFRGKR